MRIFTPVNLFEGVPAFQSSNTTCSFPTACGLSGCWSSLWRPEVRWSTPLPDFFSREKNSCGTSTNRVRNEKIIFAVPRKKFCPGLVGRWTWNYFLSQKNIFLFWRSKKKKPVSGVRRATAWKIFRNKHEKLFNEFFFLLFASEEVWVQHWRELILKRRYYFVNEIRRLRKIILWTRRWAV